MDETEVKRAWSMSPQTAERLVALNRDFYERFGAEFTRSRGRPQPGWKQLLPELAPARPLSVLDVGCADGRFGRYLHAGGIDLAYCGVDFAGSLLEVAHAPYPMRLLALDMSRPGCLDGLGEFHLVACLSTLQHIPGYKDRARLLAEMRDCLAPAGLLILANWQFLTNERQRRKVRDWSQAGIDPAEVEPGDYLLSWERGGNGLRYAAYVDETATADLAAAAGLRIVGQFRADGREGDLNLYTLLRS